MSSGPVPPTVPSVSKQTKVLEGCFAVNKPSGISSAQVLRDLQKYFDPSDIFAPAIAEERARRAEIKNQPGRRSRTKRGRVQVKIGHGGTLDPEATGVLITGIGSGTKSLTSFLACTKTYECVVLFGAATDTYDAVGKVVGRKPYEHITKEIVEQALTKFRGKIMQKPPIYSALNVQGKRLYEYAREGLEVPIEIKARPVEVESLEMLEWMEGGQHDFKLPEAEAEQIEKDIAGKLLDLGAAKDEVPAEGAVPEGASPDLKRKRDEADGEETVSEIPESKRLREESEPPTMSGALQPAEGAAQPSTTRNVVGPPAVRLRMTVTSGFYVRSLCHDLGAAVNSLALMSTLVRSRQGDFELGKNVFEYDDLEKGEVVWAPKVEAMLNDWNQKQASSQKS